MPAHPPRVVIDTNVLLSAIVFKTGALSALRDAWQTGKCIPVISRATAEEFIAVLKYPKFKLTAEEQDAALAAYLPYCEVLAEPKTRLKLPTCRDEDDQPFLLLAVASKAEALISGDKDLLLFKGKLPFEIASPADWLSKQGV